MKNFFDRISLTLLLVAMAGCAFQPRQVDVQAVEGQISIPDVSFEGRYSAKFLPVVDKRANRANFGVGRNKLMMVTTSVSMKGDLAATMNKLVRKNFQSAGITDGEGPLTIEGQIIESHTDARGPDHIFVRIKFALSIVNSSNEPVFHEVFTGYSVVPVVQLGNAAHETAFIDAMNQISDKVHAVAVMTRQEFDSRGGTFRSPTPSDPGSRPASSSGTGIIVSGSGAVITNQHVVGSCDEITVTRAGMAEPARLVFADSRNDLAVIQASARLGTPAVLRGGAYVRPGEDVIAIGFPLQDMLSDEPKITQGMVNSLAGLANDMRVLQVSAPIQPGNSGGPLLDMSGHLVGVVTSKLDAIKMAEYTGDVPQNVNFALKTSLVKDILDAKGIRFSTAESTGRLSKVEIFERAREFTVLIECR
jgi:S1-C subfamily serine protease